ncbi:MAG: hypothetical protein ACQEP2_07625 [Actinomycetota bacterium]
MTILGEYKDNIVLVGGWVPYFLIEDKKETHIGSIDIDLAIDSNAISNDAYRTILELLRKKGYEKGRQPFIFTRSIKDKDSNIYTIEIDFLSGEYGGTGKSHRTQKIQDINARKARGCDLAFKNNLKVSMENQMPDGSINQISFKLANVIPFLVMKGMAIWERFKEKDAYDIYFIFRNYPGGINELALIFNGVKFNRLVKEGLGKIYAKFSSVDDIGPTWLVKFLDIEDEEEEDRMKRDAYERVNLLMQKLGIKKFKEEL